MRVAKVFGADMKIDPLLLAILAPAALLGLLDMLLVSLLTVLVHELGHAAAAHCLGIRVMEVELMPFGGVARLAGINDAGSVREFIIALAGPTVNFLIIGILTSIVNAHPETVDVLGKWISASLAIGLFNLLPAYPLDGGRMLRAAMKPFLGQERATRIAIWIGVAMGSAIVVSAIVTACTGGKLNLTLLSVGGFVVVSALRENRETAYAAVRRTSAKRQKIKDSTLPEKRLAANVHTQLRELVRGFSQSAYHVVTVVDDNMDVIGSVGENEIVRAMINQGGKQTLEQLVARAH